jgi:HAD superfamily hydrolase (TIGR01509 family)
VEIIKALRSDGLQVAIVTSAYPSIVEKVLKCHGINNLFDEIFGSRQGEPHKPDPAIYRRALEFLGLEPNQVIAIEDSQSGLRSAADAGITTIAFTPDSDTLYSSAEKTFDFLQASSWQEIGGLLNNRRKS